MEISSKAKIRFIDCDPIGHLNNSKYLDYMLNAREDHVAENYGYTYEEYTQKTGCTWIAIQNEIAYLKEVRFNKEVVISSKLIDLQERTAKVEILMKDPSSDKIHAVLWCTVIHFNLKTLKSEMPLGEARNIFEKFLMEIEHKDFQSRVNYLRKINKL